MYAVATPVKRRCCGLLGAFIGFVWLLGVCAVFSLIRDPVFGNWSNGAASNFVVLANVAAYLSTSILAASLPLSLSARYRNLRSLLWLILGALTPLALVLVLVLGFGNIAGLAR